MDSRFEVGYCTNVHAGVTLKQIKANLEQHALPVKQQCSRDQPMGIGLWIPNEACHELSCSDSVEGFKDWLQARGLRPFTFNAFPFSDFHQPVVKHSVYEPTWASAERLEYTLAIADIHAQLLGVGEFGTISTLPLSWPDDTSDDFIRKCSEKILKCSDALAKIHERTGRHIFVCIEPEPGCTLGCGSEVAEFFERFLLTGNEAQISRVRDYIGVCHDVCHCAVVFDDQQDDIQRYKDLEIRVGKYQISSAIEANFDGKMHNAKRMLVDELTQFAEDRYLHQTSIAKYPGKPHAFYDDLPRALLDENSPYSNGPIGVWRVHFHVPIFADNVGHLGTTRKSIDQLMNSVEIDDEIPLHFEIETYAWTVLPASLQPNSLAEGIAKEMKYFCERCLPLLGTN